ncbi:uncharacterized protein ASPGLDRAFT_1212507 [Aspergillus glaucus CBS 516.65]|uniref:Uncharacterized protein n=1 Tax=Aspergillus glaucus CBS 516.65 TaxID=1160497 RepID=A0A1L9V3F4_ASPGL|nr:hypothetical protein ASPGLDRAFT_1212507 [Aspergillus glaucus CBS 516.65]OJJ78463.1 hypothetical protein ASPGLDRAFT_1212507 [Aspergillus glaucus CBS 516.65]
MLLDGSDQASADCHTFSSCYKPFAFVEKKKKKSFAAEMGAAGVLPNARDMTHLSSFFRGKQVCAKTCLCAHAAAQPAPWVLRKEQPLLLKHIITCAPRNRQEKEPEPINHTEDADMGDAPEVHVTPNATPLIPINPHQSPTQAGPEPSKQAQGDPTLPQKTNI